MAIKEGEVLVVAAGNAWPFYVLASAYVCQARRFFRPVDRMAFYSKRTIHGVVPTIEEEIDDMVLSEANAAKLSMSLDERERRLGNVIGAALSGAWKEGEPSKILLLTSQDDPRTVRFDPITHSGPAAWTMGQRYTSLALLRVATSTDDLAQPAVALVTG